MAGGGLGFGAGIAKGLSNAFLREHAEKEATRARDFSTLFPVYLDNAINSGDYSGLENFVAQFGGPDLAKSLRKNQPFAALAPLLAGQRREGEMGKVLSPPTLGAPQQGGGQTGMFGLQQPQAEPAPPSGLATPNAEPGPPGSPQPLTAGPQLVSPTVQAPLPVQQSSQSTFFGSPMLTPTQRAENATKIKLSTDKILIDARRSIALKLGWTPEQANYYALTGEPQPQTAATLQRGQSIAGEAPDAQGVYHPTFGIFDPVAKKYLDQDTGQPIEGFRPRATRGPTAGVDVERAAQALGYQRFSDVPREERAAVEQKAREMAQQFGQAGAYGRTTGQTQAQIDAIKGSGLVQTVIDNPVVLQTLPDAAKEKLAPLLAEAGFDFQRGTSMTPSMQAGVSRLKSSLTMLQQLDPALTQRTGAAGRAAGTIQDWWTQLTGEDSPVSIYRGVSDSLLPALARASGEVGNLAEQEQTRYARLAPKVGDPLNVRQAKYAAIQYLIDAAGRGATAAEMVPFLDYMKFAAQGGTGSPAGASGAAGGTGGASGRPYQDKNGNWVIPRPGDVVP